MRGRVSTHCLKLLSVKTTCVRLRSLLAQVVVRVLLFTAKARVIVVRCMTGPKYVLLVGCHDREFSNNALALCLMGQAMKNWIIFAICNKDCGKRLKAM